MHLTNTVFIASLNCSFDLKKLCYELVNVKYNPRRFNGLIWQHPVIGGNCLLFRNGKINCNGKVRSFKEGRQRLRRYARVLQKLGYSVNLNEVKMVTASAFHVLSGPVDIPTYCREHGASYEPELFPVMMFKKNSVHFSCYQNGKIVITGIKSSRDIDDTVYPVLIELELYTI